MITKERLLAGLEELLHVEESAVALYAKFDIAMVNATEGMEEGRKTEIKKLLSTLYRDSTRHKETVDSMIEHIEMAGKNEY